MSAASPPVSVVTNQLSDGQLVLNNPPIVAGSNLGDVLVGVGGGRYARLAVGADGQMMLADSTQPTGVKWGPWSNPVITATSNLEVGASAPLGDNGVGEIQLANATTAPTTNPTGGVDIYCVNGGIFIRDANGTVSSLISTLRTGAASWGAVTETVNHNAASQVNNSAASGELQIMSVGIEAGRTISSLGFCTGTTAANSPSHWWLAVLDKNFVQQAHTADQLTAALPASTWQKLSLVTPYTTPYTGIYYLGILIAGSGAQPTVLASGMAAQFVTGTNVPSPPVGGRSSTSLTGPGVDGVTTYISPTGVSGFYYIYGI